MCGFWSPNPGCNRLLSDQNPLEDARRAAASRVTVRTATGADRAVQQQVEQLVVEREMQAILDYSRRPDGACPEWEHKAGIVTAMAVLTPGEAAAVKEKWIELLAPYTVRADDSQREPGQRAVRYFMAATPLPEHTPADDTTEAADG